MTESSATPGQESPKIDTDVPQSARIWNYWLGGKDNYPVDREVGDQFCEIFPDIILVARASRAFIARSVRYLTGEAGIRQFLDIGTGLPSANNTHEVAQRVAPHSRIVYVDNEVWNQASSAPYCLRSIEQIARFFDGLELVEPGVVSCPRWRPEANLFGVPAEVDAFGGVGRKP